MGPIMSVCKMRHPGQHSRGCSDCLDCNGLLSRDMVGFLFLLYQQPVPPNLCRLSCLRSTLIFDLQVWCRSNVKELAQLSHGVLGPLDGVADGAGVVVDFPVVAARESLVPEEVDGFVVHAGEVFGRVRLGLDVPEAVGLVPTGGEDVERDLTSD